MDTTRPSSANDQIVGAAFCVGYTLRRSMSPTRRDLVAIGFVCFGSLLLEVLLTRIFSASMAYHFTFVAIALALFGLGASGVYVYVRQQRFTAEHARADMSRWARRFAATTLLALVYVLANPMDIIFIWGTSRAPLFTYRTLWQLVLLNGTTALPFFCAGMVVSLAVWHWRQSIQKVYFYDLCGAGAAALMAGALLGILGAPSAVLLCTLFALAGAALFERPRGLRLLPVALALLCFTASLATKMFSLPSVKGVSTDEMLFEGWNSFSRITVDKRLWIKIDSGAATPLTSATLIGNPQWKREISALAYSLPEGGPGEVLVIGPGGGRDVVHALSSGARRVTGVEINPLIAHKVMDQRFLKESGGLYRHPKVRIVIADGRSYVRRSKETYDIIQASLVDTNAASAAGAFALTENTLYTVEAFEDYLAHLTDRGALTMTRWYGRDAESERLVVLAAAALERRGVPPGQTRKYLYFAGSSGQGTLVAKRTPFQPDEIARLDAAATAAGFHVVLSPTTPGTDQLERFVDAGAWSNTVASYAQDITPSTDDRPFFFYFVKASDLWSLSQWLGKTGSLDRPAFWILISFGIAIIVLALAFILAPLLVSRAQTKTVPLAYFGLLGLAFIVVEMALMQKLTFFLGHPTYSLLVVLFSLLVGTAVGARVSAKASPILWGFALAALFTVYAFGLGPLLGWLVGLPIALRILLAVVLVGSGGLMMGVMLPAGVRHTGATLLPWAWGMNGATSVIGTVGAIVLAVHVGFRATLLVGAGSYALAAVMATLLVRGRASVKERDLGSARESVAAS